MQPKSGNRYDITIKDLFADETQELINYFGHLEARVTGDLKIEFPQVETRVSDLVMKAESQQGPLAIHLEFQSRNDDEMPYRMLRYALEIHKTYHLPVYQIVIYFGQWQMNMTSQLEYRLGDQNLLDYRYHLIDVGNITYEELKNSPHQRLLSLLPVVDREKRQKGGKEFLQRCAEDIINSDLDLETKKTVLLRAEIFAGLVFDKKAIDLVFREVEQMLSIEESAGYQRIFEKGMEKGIEKGMEKGIEKGMEKGMEKGQQESLLDVTIRLLSKKFRKIPREYLARIKEQDVYVLQQIIDSIFDINDLKELEDYLQ
ncbi:hypothetical protein MTCOM_20670 [Moorella thermoacetica]